MIHLLSRSGAFALILAIGFGSCVAGRDLPSIFVSTAVAQNADATPAGEPVDSAGQQTQGMPATPRSPAAPDQALTSEMAHTDAKGRHLAPRGTFYLLSYVSVTTDKGVEGFEPGQEVHFVEAHRDRHTLVVSYGHAQVEVPPSKLTNDMDIAAMVRRNDQANQAQISAYVEAEEAAYNKAERDAALATAKDLEHREQAQAAQAQLAEQAQAQQQPTPQTNPPIENNDYYNEGGYGYGSPYSYFSGGSPVIAFTPRTPATAPAAPAAASAPAPGKVAAPAAPAAGVGRPNDISPLVITCIILAGYQRGRLSRWARQTTLFACPDASASHLRLFWHNSRIVVESHLRGLEMFRHEIAS